MKYLVTVLLAAFAGNAICEDITITADEFESSIREEVRSSAVGRAAVTVIGETRTVDEADRPRLWGKGRGGVVRYGTTGIESGLCVHGNVEFGLSNVMSDWNGAADTCPAGTWVCSSYDVGGSIVCDTARPDSTDDYQNCDGTWVDRSATSHYGWLADIDLVLPGYPYSRASESGSVTASTNACRYGPSWCCSEIPPL